jgi:hypothetical protein
LPSLRAAWRALVAPLALAPLGLAATAHADATVPPGGQQPGPRQPAPSPRPHIPRLGGKIAVPRPASLPEPPSKPWHAAAPSRSALLLHPHAPDEPCFPLEREPA